MVIKSKYRGYEIEDIGGEWFFVESGKPVNEIPEYLLCGYCGKKNTKEGHDGCLGTLLNVMNACCGHGQTRETYVQFPDGTIIDGNFAKRFIEKLQTKYEE